jgi:hypothetical protein
MVWGHEGQREILPWVKCGRDACLLRAAVYDQGRPALRWVWHSPNSIVLEGVETATGEKIKRFLPGLTLLRKVIHSGGRPPEDRDSRTERRREQAARIWALRGGGRTVKDAAAEVGVSEREAQRLCSDFPQ